MKPLDRRRLLQRLGLAAAAAALPSSAADALASTAAETSFPSHPRWKFNFLSFLTTSPLFVPLQYGVEDACAVFGCTFAWGGTAKGDPRELAKAVSAAVASKSDGIALTVTDVAVLDASLGSVLEAGIPVVAFHAEPPRTGARQLPYIGQDRRSAGAQLGARIAKSAVRGEVALLVGSHDAAVAQTLVEGILKALAPTRVRASVVDTGPDVYAQIAAVEKRFLSAKGLRGMFALDVGSTLGVTTTVRKHQPDPASFKAGGYGVLPATLELIDSGRLELTLDEQPYLQGFAAVMQLFLAKLSGGLVEPGSVRTGPVFVTKQNVKPYLTTRTRYEGSSSREKYPIG